MEKLICQCDNCSKSFDIAELNEIAGYLERVTPNAPAPAGECPDCGALAYAVAETKPKIIIAVEGGLVSAVVSHDPSMIGIEVAIIDYDTDGADDAEVSNVEQKDGSFSEAIVRLDTIEQATIKPLRIDV